MAWIEMTKTEEPSVKEVEALAQAYAVLAPLDPAARGRALRWIIAKLRAEGGVKGLLDDY